MQLGIYVEFWVEFEKQKALVRKSNSVPFSFRNIYSTVGCRLNLHRFAEIYISKGEQLDVTQNRLIN